MPRNNLRSHLVGGSVAIAALLIGSGAAWAQSGAATASGESDAASSAGGSVTGVSDAALSTNPLGLSPQSTGARSSNRRQADSFEDAAVDGVVRHDGGLRFAPTFSANANTNTGDLPGRAAASSRALGLTAPGPLAQTNGDGRAFGLNATLSDSAPASARGIDNSNGRALGANMSFFAIHVQSKGTTEPHPGETANGKKAETASTTDAVPGERGNGKKFDVAAIGNAEALAGGRGKGKNKETSEADDGENGNGKKLGHAKNLERFDESSLVRVGTNPVVSEAVAPGIAAIIAAGLPAAAAASVDDLSSTSPGLQAAPSPVPEPANWLLLALGLAVLAWRALMRRGTSFR